MKYTPHIPTHPALRDAIEVMFVLEEYAPEHRRERLVPDGRMNLVIELDGRRRHIYDNETGAPRQVCEGAWLSGVQSNYITIGETDVESRLMAVQFAPGATRRFTHRAASEFVDRVVPAADVFGPEILELRQEMLGLDSPETMLARLADWLAEREDSDLRGPDHVMAVLGKLQENPAEVGLTELVETATNVSYRHFVESFRDFVGPNPKSMQRILRFSRVFQEIQQNEAVDWAHLSQDLGYSDQAHFIREFSRFSGYRPREFRDQGHDRTNFFPEADDDPSVSG